VEREGGRELRNGFEAAVRAAGLGTTSLHTFSGTPARPGSCKKALTVVAAGFLGMTAQQLEQGYGHNI